MQQPAGNHHNYDAIRALLDVEDPIADDRFIRDKFAYDIQYNIVLQKIQAAEEKLSAVDFSSWVLHSRMTRDKLFKMAFRTDLSVFNLMVDLYSMLRVKVYLEVHLVLSIDYD